MATKYRHCEHNEAIRHLLSSSGLLRAIALAMTILFFFSISAYSQCPNLNFSYGDFTNWKYYEGSSAVFTSPQPYLNKYKDVAIMNNANPQQYQNSEIYSPIFPVGYNYSCRIGYWLSTNGLPRVSAIEYVLTIDSSNCYLNLYFAIVIGYVQYTGWGSPSQFSVQLKNSAGVHLPIPNSNMVFYQQDCKQNFMPNYAARPWDMVQYDLSQFIGQTIKIYFEARGASNLQNLLCLAYVLADCSSTPMQEVLLCGNRHVNLSLPAGHASYTWSRSSDTLWKAYGQQITVSNPSPFDKEIITCDVGYTGKYSFIIRRVDLKPQFLFGIKDTNGDVDFASNNNQSWYDTCSRTATFVDFMQVVNSEKSGVVWTINGLKIGSDSMFTYTFPEPSSNQPVTYKVCPLVYTKSGCNDTICQDITIYPTPKVKIRGNAQTCPREWLKAEAVRSVFFSHQWTWLDENNVTHTFTGDSIQVLGSGIYMLESVSYGGCTARDTLKVNTLETVIAFDSIICGENNGKIQIIVTKGTPPYSFKIEKEDGTLVSSSAIADGLSAGTYIVTVTDAGCVKSDTVTITTTYIEAVSLASAICGEDNGEIDFKIVNPVEPITYKWNPNKNSKGDILQTNSIRYLKAGVYTLRFTDANNCVIDTSFIIDSFPLPIISYKIHPEICRQEDGSITLSVTSAAPNAISYQWIELSDTNNEVSNLKSGTYTVKIKDSLCEVTEIITVPHIDGPVADFVTPSYPVLINVVFTLTDASKGSLQSWFWDMGDGNTLSGKEVRYTYNEIGDYVVFLEVTDTNGCTDTISKIMQVYDKLQVFIPNTFTPNADNLNDMWKPFLLGYAQEGYMLSLYDRWGNRIFHTTNPNISWDGTINGKPAQNNTAYSYCLIVKDLAGKEHKYTGGVTVVR